MKVQNSLVLDASTLLVMMHIEQNRLDSENIRPESLFWVVIEEFLHMGCMRNDAFLVIQVVWEVLIYYHLVDSQV